MNKNILVLLILLSGFCVLPQQLKWAKMYPANQYYNYPEQIEVSNTFNIAMCGQKVIPANTGLNKGLFLNYSDSTGSLLWSCNVNTYTSCTPTGIAFNQQGELYFAGIFQDSAVIDNNLYFGNSGSNSFVIKFNNAGIKKMVKIYPGLKLTGITVDHTNNLTLLATINDTISLYGQTIIPAYNSDAFIFKVDTTDNMIFSTLVKGTIYGRQIDVSPSGNIYLFGGHHDSLKTGNFAVDCLHRDDPSYFVLKMNSQGAPLSFSHTCSDQNETAVNFWLKHDDRFIVSGHHGGPHGSEGGHFELYDNVAKRKAKTGVSTFNDDLCGVMLDTSSFWTLGTETIGDTQQNDGRTHLALYKVTGSGWALARDTIDIPGGKNVLTADINHNLYAGAIVAPNKTFTIQGTVLTNTNASLYSYFIAKYSSNVIAPVGVTENKFLNNVLSLYPNPVNNELNISYSGNIKDNVQVKIYTVLGREVLSDKFQKYHGDFNKKFDLKELSTGIYFVTFITDHGTISRKIVKN